MTMCLNYKMKYNQECWNCLKHLFMHFIKKRTSNNSSHVDTGRRARDSTLLCYLLWNPSWMNFVARHCTLSKSLTSFTNFSHLSLINLFFPLQHYLNENKRHGKIDNLDKYDNIEYDNNIINCYWWHKSITSSNC